MRQRKRAPGYFSCLLCHPSFFHHISHFSPCLSLWLLMHPPSLSLSFSLIYIPRPLASSLSLSLHVSYPLFLFLLLKEGEHGKQRQRDGGCGGSGGGCVHFLLWTKQKGGKDSKKSGVGVDREAKEDRDRDFYLHPCESYSVPG